MNTHDSHPSWLVLYILIGLVLLVLFLEVKMPFSSTVHTCVEIGLVLLLFGLVNWWLSANTANLIREEHERNIITARSTPSQSRQPSTATGELYARSNIHKNRMSPKLRYAGLSLLALISTIWTALLDVVHQLF